jgi:hypothetical protein
MRTRGEIWNYQIRCSIYGIYFPTHEYSHGQLSVASCWWNLVNKKWRISSLIRLLVYTVYKFCEMEKKDGPKIPQNKASARSSVLQLSQDKYWTSFVFNALVHPIRLP